MGYCTRTCVHHESSFTLPVLCFSRRCRRGSVVIASLPVTASHHVSLELIGTAKGPPAPIEGTAEWLVASVCKRAFSQSLSGRQARCRDSRVRMCLVRLLETKGKRDKHSKRALWHEGTDFESSIKPLNSSRRRTPSVRSCHRSMTVETLQTHRLQCGQTCVLVPVCARCDGRSGYIWQRSDNILQGSPCVRLGKPRWQMPCHNLLRRI